MEESLNLKETWESVCDHIARASGEHTRDHWFSNTELVEADGEALTLLVPNQIYQVWIESNHLPVMQEAILSVLGGPRKVVFRFSESEEEIADNQIHTDNFAEIEETKNVKERGRVAELKLEDSADWRQVAPAMKKVSKAAASAGLNPRYTFENFVVGGNNQLAQAAAVGVADHPASSYNPLFIHGGPGLGKTHLMNAIGHHVLKKKPRAKVVYVTCEEFMNDFISSIQTNNQTAFRKRYRQADVVMVDDVEFLGGKDSTQEEFFHTFNALSDGRRQIVLSCDSPPSQIRNLEQRLISRFEWGLTVQLLPPDVELRVAILRRKLGEWEVDVDEAIIAFLAERITNNVRRLEGALLRVAAYRSLSGGEVNAGAVERLLHDILQEQALKPTTIDEIQRGVADYFDVRLADMTSKRRPANIAFARQVAMYLSREMTKSSLASIGDAFGGRDHGTVIHAVKTVSRKMAADDDVRRVVTHLKESIQQV
ncbi:MAG: chromosomal replication initiator protein DnaA [Verrucomicrobiota bacterium]